MGGARCFGHLEEGQSTGSNLHLFTITHSLLLIIRAMHVIYWNTEIYNNENKICNPSLATVNILVCSVLIFFSMALWDLILNAVLYHDF